MIALVIALVGLLGPAAAVPKPASDLKLQADILALKHVSRILGHCNNPALLFYPFVRVASPPV